MSKEFKIREYGKEYRIKFLKTNYPSTGNTAIQALCYDEEFKGWLPYALCTINVDCKLPEDMAGIKDYSENVGIFKLMLDEKIIEDEPVKYIHSGFVMIGIYKIDMSKVCESNEI